MLTLLNKIINYNIPIINVSVFLAIGAAIWILITVILLYCMTRKHVSRLYLYGSGALILLGLLTNAYVSIYYSDTLASKAITNYISLLTIVFGSRAFWEGLMLSRVERNESKKENAKNSNTSQDANIRDPEAVLQAMDKEGVRDNSNLLTQLNAELSVSLALKAEDVSNRNLKIANISCSTGVLSLVVALLALGISLIQLSAHK